MLESRASFSSTHINAGACEVSLHCAGSGDDHIVRLTALLEAHDLYLVGTLDELAKFVLDLAGVVRELNARELDAIGARTPCPVCNADTVHDGNGVCQGVNGPYLPGSAVVDELQARR